MKTTTFIRMYSSRSSLSEPRHLYPPTATTAAAAGPHRCALILGSSGALGSLISRYLSQQLGMKILGADLMELPNDFNGTWELDGFISLAATADNNGRKGGRKTTASSASSTSLRPTPLEFSNLTTTLARDVHYFLKDQELKGLDVIVCASGGWEGNPPPFPIRNNINNNNPIVDETPQSHILQLEESALEYAAVIERMRKMNLDPVLAAGFVAQHFMNPTVDTLMIVMGATAALSPTPGMLGYGLSKIAAHHLVQTLGATTGTNSLEHKVTRLAAKQVRQPLPSLDRLRVVGILPTMMDTNANRKANPQGDFTQWVKPVDIAQEIGMWIDQPSLRPHSGSLVRVHPKSDGPGARFELVR